MDPHEEILLTPTELAFSLHSVCIGSFPHGATVPEIVDHCWHMGEINLVKLCRRFDYEKVEDILNAFTFLFKTEHMLWHGIPTEESETELRRKHRAEIESIEGFTSTDKKNRRRGLGCQMDSLELLRLDDKNEKKQLVERAIEKARLLIENDMFLLKTEVQEAILKKLHELIKDKFTILTVDEALSAMTVDFDGMNSHFVMAAAVFSDKSRSFKITATKDNFFLVFGIGLLHQFHGNLQMSTSSTTHRHINDRKTIEDFGAVLSVRVWDFNMSKLEFVGLLTSDQRQFEKMQNTIQTIVSNFNGPAFPIGVYKKSHGVFVRFNNNQYYRGRIRKVLEKEGQLSVRLIDLTNEIQVSVEDVVPIATGFEKDSFGLKCRIRNTEKFKELIKISSKTAMINDVQNRFSIVPVGMDSTHLIVDLMPKKAKRYVDLSHYIHAPYSTEFFRSMSP